MSKRTDKKSTPGRIAWLLAALISCTLAVLYYRGAPVKLDSERYDLAIALYRVCNQRSDDGLVQIERRLNEAGPSGAEPDTQNEALRGVLQEARDGKWLIAMTACRELLEDQVGR